MKILVIKRIHMFVIFTLWWSFFVALSLIQANPFQALNIIGFSFLMLVPGLLTLFLLKIKNIEFWGYLGLTVGFSLLELMVLMLLGNTFLPLIGIARPLDQVPLIVEVSAFTAVLLFLNLIRTEKVDVNIHKFLIFDNFKDLIFAACPLLFVIMSILGSTYLNNGGSGNITLVMLIGIGVYLPFLIWQNSKLGKNVIPVSLFFLSLSLLFMTSLRGWYVTGHDIQREYRVFELAKGDGIWSIERFKDAYNACMSITILPTIFSNLLKMFDPYVYKVFFQIIFAMAPSLIFLIVKKFVNSTIALISTIYFIAFPTFFGDMPFLNRQEIAFVFFILMFYVVFNKNISLLKRQIVFVIFGIGLVLSHYTTNYTVVALLIFLILAKPFVNFLGKRYSKIKLFYSSGIELSGHYMKPNITVWMVAVLVVSTFLWTSVLTNTASNSLYRVIAETISTMRNNVNEDVRSTAVSYSLFSFQKLDPKTLFSQYLKNVVDKARNSEPAGTYYESSTYDKYPIQVIDSNNMPLTKLGFLIHSYGINVVAFNNIVRQSSAKALQLLVILGMFIVLLKRKFLIRLVNSEFFLLTVGSLLFVLAQVVLPVLSTEYGVMRAFQQSMLFLGIFIVIGSLGLAIRMKDKIKIVFASIVAILFFLSSTGVITQILGGYGAQLHLNNNGIYYDSYYVRKSELLGINWLSDQFKDQATPQYQTEVQTDRFQSTKVSAISDISPLNDINPGLIRRNSYVYLGNANINKLQAIFSYNDTGISYTYPIQFLDEQKDLIYNNGGSRIYK